jgi:hypothetical protein
MTPIICLTDLINTDKITLLLFAMLIKTKCWAPGGAALMVCGSAYPKRAARISTILTIIQKRNEFMIMLFAQQALVLAVLPKRCSVAEMDPVLHHYKHGI